MAPTENLPRRPSFSVQVRSVLLSLAAATALVATLATLFQPVWETNDDVAMAMVAHGYGFVSEGSANLLFSNVLWGMVVRSLDGLSGLQGYSLGTLGTLLVSAWSLLYFLWRLGISAWIALPAVIAALTWPILFPQFTMNAGLATTAAMLGFYAYGRTRSPALLVVSGLLALVGFLIRSLEFALVFAVSAPLLPWRLLLKDKTLQAFSTVLLFSCVAAHLFNMAAYQTPAWQAFSEFNHARAPYTDFGIGTRIVERPDILEAYGYSANDIGLVTNWFFEDPQLAQAGVLKSMVAELGPSLGPLSASRLDVMSGLQALSQLYTPRFIPLVFVAMLLVAPTPHLPLLASAGLAVTAAFGLGLVGANVHGRVLFPLVILVTMFAVARSGTGPSQWGRQVVAIIMMASAAYTLYAVPRLAYNSKARVGAAQALIAAHHDDILFVWGSGLDYEGAYPVRSTVQWRQAAPPLYALGVMAHAPFSVAAQQREQNQGMIDRLRWPGGIEVAMPDYSLARLRIFCQEHLATELKMLSETGGVRRVTCASPVE